MLWKPNEYSWLVYRGNSVAARGHAPTMQKAERAAARKAEGLMSLSRRGLGSDDNTVARVSCYFTGLFSSDPHGLSGGLAQREQIALQLRQVEA